MNDDDDDDDDTAWQLHHSGWLKFNSTYHAL